MKYKLDCWSVDKDDFLLHDASGHSEGLGYAYEDLVFQPFIPPDQKFIYKVSLRTNVKMLGDETLNLFVDFRDWKYMSNFHRFQIQINDTDIILGKKEGSIEIDFAEMINKDEAGESNFEVAGRLFFEASVFGLTFTSYTTSGFFDRLGYEEP